MRAIIRWLKDNLSNLFSVLGIGLTIYFSIFYIPEYVQETKKAKIFNINSDLTETVQELVYNHQQIDVHDIKTLIKGKEIKYHVTYTYTIDELLVQTQEQFMSNRFIPLEERKKLVDKIDLLRREIKPIDQPQEIGKTNKDVTTTASIIVSILAGLIAALSGIWSLSVRLKNEKDANIAKSIESEKENIAEFVKSGFQYVNEVEKALKGVGLNYSSSTEFEGNEIDLIVHTEDSDCAIEIRYLKDQAISANILTQLFHLANLLQMPVYLVSNARTPLIIQNKIKEFNKDNPTNTVCILKAETSDELISVFRKTFTKKATQPQPSTDRG